MQVSRPLCNYCGALCDSEDDVNAAKSYCYKCSKVRSSLAKRAFRGRCAVVTAGGNYIVSKRMEKRIPR